MTSRTPYDTYFGVVINLTKFFGCTPSSCGGVTYIHTQESIVNEKQNQEEKYLYESDTVSTYQVSLVQLVTDKKLEAFNKV